MFHAEQIPDSGCADHLTATNAPEKRQYTIKGIEAEAVELMRGAARKEGMKIGAWISARMKEAAFRSLGPTAHQPGVVGQNENALGHPAGEAEGSEMLVTTIHKFDQRLRQIEEELQEVTKIQRTMLAKMLERS